MHIYKKKYFSNKNNNKINLTKPIFLIHTVFRLLLAAIRVNQKKQNML